MRIGIGYDVHRLVEDRDLILGGVKIPFEKGLLGHSDADVLLHAISDALLGAANLGDIGVLFPDNDEKYKNANSLLLLKEVVEKVREKGYEIENIDSIIIAEKPKMRKYISEMCENISNTCDIPLDRISIKATTEEGLGFSGKGEGIAAKAIALLK